MEIVQFVSEAHKINPNHMRHTSTMYVPTTDKQSRAESHVGMWAHPVELLVVVRSFHISLIAIAIM